MIHDVYKRTDRKEGGKGGLVYSLVRIKHVAKHNTATSHVHIDRQRLGLGLGAKHLLLFVGRGLGFICSCKLPHQCVPTVVVEVHTGNVCIIEGTGTGTLVVLTATAGAVEVARTTSLDTTASMAGK
jgi:hypothetical protein